MCNSLEYLNDNFSKKFLVMLNLASTHVMCILSTIRLIKCKEHSLTALIECNNYSTGLIFLSKNVLARYRSTQHYGIEQSRVQTVSAM